MGLCWSTVSRTMQHGGVARWKFLLEEVRGPKLVQIIVPLERCNDRGREEAEEGG